MPPTEPLLLTIEQVGDLLGVSYDSAYREVTGGRFGAYDKLTMTRTLLDQEFGIDLDAERDAILFVGDSPNDEPMFKHFPLSVGVANIGDFLHRLQAKPAFVTQGRSGTGFVELATRLLESRSAAQSGSGARLPSAMVA